MYVKTAICGRYLSLDLSTLGSSNDKALWPIKSELKQFSDDHYTGTLLVSEFSLVSLMLENVMNPKALKKGP